MKRQLFILGFFLGVYSFLNAADDQKFTVAKKKIAIAWSKGGGAHKSMLDALKTYLSEDYEVIPFCPFEIGWGELDPVRRLSFKYADSEDMYNYLLANDLPWLINNLHYFGLNSLRRHRKHIERRLNEYLDQIMPDMVISVIPFLNSALADVVTGRGKPFLLMAPDLNLRSYFISKIPTENFYCTIPFNDELGWKTAIRAGINPHTIKATGFPLRMDFFGEKDLVAIRKDFEIPADKPAVMILMGGVGSSKVLKYAKHLSKKTDYPLHLIVCIGKKEEMRAKIARIKRKPNITISIVGHTPRISDLMSVSDALITKPGPTSISEAIQRQLPLLLDNTSTTLELERLHLDFVKKNEMGFIINRMHEVDRALKSLICNPSSCSKIKQTMKRFGHDSFPDKTRQIIRDIFDADSVQPKLNA